jgi:uncharacterized protein (DUF433 family)
MTTFPHWLCTGEPCTMGTGGKTMAVSKRELVCEIRGGYPYEYYPLGEHVVSAPGVCQGEPTFKYTRIGVRHAVELISGGRTVREVATAYELPVAAVREALALALRALHERIR